MSIHRFSDFGRLLGRVLDPPLPPILPILTVLSALPALSLAQSSDHGAYVVRLGTDTVSVETFTRTATTLMGDRVIRSPRVSLLHYEATLGSDGRITRLAASSRPGNRLDLPPLQSATIDVHGDSADISLTQADSTRSYVMHIRPGAVPMFNSTYALYAQMARQLVREKADSLGVDMILPGVLTATPTSISRIGRDSVAIDYYGSPMRARIDAQGRMEGLQASMTTVKVVVTRQDSADVDALAHAFAAAEIQAGPLGQMSPRDTAHAMIAGAMLMVDYGRPHMRGRKIFGGIVPMGEVWRTGANAATQFSTDKPLVLGNVTLPAGMYTLWSVPGENGAQLIINRQTGQWGTDYDAGKDLARVPLRQSALPEPVEVFTISIRPRGANGGTLVFEWEKTRWEADFEVKTEG
jgi:hypothetical protein